MSNTLELVLILLAVAVMVVVVFRMLHLPPLVGYLLVGIIIGPHALHWIPDTETAHTFAEFGVVFLMFSIGLEFSLSRLMTMRRLVFGFGGAQVGITIAVVFSVGVLLGLDWRAAFVLGGILAMSSTAIVGKMLADRLEVNSPHGRQMMGVLLFQDLTVIPLLIIIPALAKDTSDVAPALIGALVKASIVLALLLFIGQRLMRPWLHLVAQRKSSELFMLNLLFITLGLAYVTERAGLSMVLGAFLAGALIAETEYRYQVEGDIKPFRDVLLGLFFVTVGMRLDLTVLQRHWVDVGLLLISIILGKTLIIATLSRLTGQPPNIAFRVALNLAQSGEFGLVLLALAASPKLGLINSEISQMVLAAMLLSMLIAPFIIQHSERFSKYLFKNEWMLRAMELHKIAVQTMNVNEHVIICGYGRSGQNLARLLEQESVPFIALDIDPQRVKAAAGAGEHVVYGDAARREVLTAAGLLRAKALVVAYSDHASAIKIINHVISVRPDLPIVVRTLDDTAIDELKAAGATEVVAEIMEGSLMLASHVLMLTGVPLTRVLKRIRQTREQRYSLFRGFFRGLSDETLDDDIMQPYLRSIIIPDGAAAIGKTIAQLKLHETHAEITTIRRRNAHGFVPVAETQIEKEDVIVLRGTDEALAAAEIRLMQGA